MAGVPGKGARIAGQDYCSYEADGELKDLDLGPGGLTVQTIGKGQTPEQTRK